jgi:hypothetical protein
MDLKKSFFVSIILDIQRRCYRYLFPCIKKALSLMFSILLYGFV